MKLKYNKQTSGSVVTVNLNVTNFSIEEKKAIRYLGSPTITFEEAYEISGTTVAIDTTISKFNELGAFTFSGSIDTIADVLDEVNSFILSIRDTLVEVMTDLMISYKEIETIASNNSGELQINDGYCHTSTADCNCSTNTTSTTDTTTDTSTNS